MGVNTGRVAWMVWYLVLSGAALGCGGQTASPNALANKYPDSDSDGVIDSRDECPWLRGTLQAFGCPDRDGDLVRDSLDQCPGEREDLNEIEDEDGCPDDQDEDGIPKSRDRCPVVPEDPDGYEDEDGCPDEDNDHDQVPDEVDRCPNTPEGPNPDPQRRGCARTSTPQYQLALNIRVHFRPNSHRVLLSPPSPSMGVRHVDEIERVAQILQRHPALVRVVRVEAHADPHERETVELAKERALAVARELVDRGISPDRLRLWACADSVPQARGNSEGARDQNRRVEFHILEPIPEQGVRSTPPGTCEEVTLDP